MWTIWFRTKSKPEELFSREGTKSCRHRLRDMTLIERPPGERGRRHGRSALRAALAAGFATQAVTLVAFCAGRPSTKGVNGSVDGSGSTTLGAFKRPVGYSRRPLRPSRFEDGPDKEGEGRGEWQGDAGKFTVNWGDPRIGRQSDPSSDQWDDLEEPQSSRGTSFEDSQEDFEERPRKRAPRRRRRARTRSEEERDDDGWVKRREPWRPPVFRREAGRREVGRQSRREPRQRSGSAPEQREEEQIKYEPPARPVNLEAMARTGRPMGNLYQLEPNDFYFYLIRELGIERMHAKIIRHYLFTKGAQDKGFVAVSFMHLVSQQLVPINVGTDLRT